MTDIAPVLFKAFPEDSSANLIEPTLECFNAAVSAGGVRALSTPLKSSLAIWAANGLIIAGLSVPAVATMAFVLGIFTHAPAPEETAMQWVGPVAIPGLGLFLAGVAWTVILSAPVNPKVKAWKKNLSAAWAAHGAEITVLDDLPAETRQDVLRYCETLEKLRIALNNLGPEGDELDLARYRLQDFIYASDLPYAGKRAAEASHITDPKVRRAAKEYKTLAEQQKLARRALTDAIAEAGTILVTRLQARNDAETIRLVHGR
jgi:hypothetical protein